MHGARPASAALILAAASGSSILPAPAATGDKCVCSLPLVPQPLASATAIQECCQHSYPETSGTSRITKAVQSVTSLKGVTGLKASRVSEIQKTWDFWISPGQNSPKSLFSGSESQKLLDFFLSLATKSVIYQFRQIPAPKSPSARRLNRQKLDYLRLFDRK